MVRPKFGYFFEKVNTPTAHSDEVCIVMQGPLLARDRFTLETIKLFNRLYPQVTVIVSTWEDENKDYIDLVSQIRLDIGEKCHSRTLHQIWEQMEQQQL